MLLSAIILLTFFIRKTLFDFPVSLWVSYPQVLDHPRSFRYGTHLMKQTLKSIYIMVYYSLKFCATISPVYHLGKSPLYTKGLEVKGCLLFSSSSMQSVSQNACILCFSNAVLEIEDCASIISVLMFFLHIIFSLLWHGLSYLCFQNMNYHKLN